MWTLKNIINIEHLHQAVVCGTHTPKVKAQKDYFKVKRNQIKEGAKSIEIFTIGWGKQ